MAELRQCDMILMDASPLIYLAKASCLGLLLKFAKCVYVADEVYFECAGRWFAPYSGYGEPPPDAIEIAGFVQANQDRMVLKDTQLGVVLRQRRLAGEKVEIQNAGEMAAGSLFDRRREITGGRSPVLVIFEDTEVPWRLANKDVHLMSTFALLVAMEKAGYLKSAQSAFDAISAGSRPSRVAVDESVFGDTTYSQLLVPR
ncbi:MAG: hypothetical protein JZU64_13565 [Rhodoferax sp.]|nr:hypothetical protein [Rhodoferax sp.]